MSEHYVSVPEQGGGKLIPEGICNPGQVYTVSQGKSGMIGVFRLESQMLPGNGKTWVLFCSRRNGDEKISRS